MKPLKKIYIVTKNGSVWAAEYDPITVKAVYKFLFSDII